MTERKRTDSIDWEDLRTVLALAEAGSLSAAARVLRVNHATVARRLAKLEADLGRPLIDRRGGGYGLTALGQSIVEAARPMEAAALAVLNRLDHAPGLEGAVRLTATRVLADCFLVRRLGDLGRRHPGLTLEVLTGSRRFSLARREADLALRFGRPTDSDLIGRRVACLGSALYAAPEMRDRVLAGAPPPLIGFDDDGADLPEAEWLTRAFPGCPLVFRSNSQTAQAQAAAAGLGLVLLPDFVAAVTPGLVPVAVGPKPLERDLWLLVRRDLATVPRVRAVADYLADLFRDVPGHGR